MPIESIEVTAVRGIRHTVKLSLACRSLLLRGDNGTGKSSLVAALRWALRGETLTGSDGGKGAREYWHHQKEPASAATVTVSLKGEAKIKVGTKGIEADDAGRIFRQACIRSNPFLLRRELLKFLEEKPGERFQYLESFLDLDQADELQQFFARQVKLQDEIRDRQESEHARLVAGCITHLPAGRRSGATSWRTLAEVLLSWADDHSLGDATSFDDLGAKLAAVRPLLKGDELGRTRERLEGLAREIRASWPEAPPRDPSSLTSRLDALESSTPDAKLVDLLERAAAHVEAHSSATDCPVCNQPIAANELKAALGRRLDAVHEASGLRTQVARLAAEWHAYWSTAAAMARKLSVAVATVSPLPETLAAAPTAPTVVAELARIGYPVAASSLQQARAAALASVEAALSALPVAESIPELRSLLSAFDSASEARLAIGLAEKGLAQATERAARFKAIAEALRKARQDVAQELLNQISGLVADYYERIHPKQETGEATGAPRIEVQRHKSGTAHIRGRFADKEVDDPRSVYSDGHLDTVGICVFLALRRFRADCDKKLDARLMVLDDVILSVDLSHARRLLDLLAAEFGDHQVLILTHNGAFYDWCATKLQGYQRLAIRSWSLEGGVEFGSYEGAFERLEDVLAKTADPRLLAQAAMNLIEPWLAEARFVYSFTMKSKRNDAYTLGEYRDGFRSALKGLNKDLGLPIIDLDALDTTLEELTKVRNGIGAHVNEFAKEFPLQMVQRVARETLGLVRKLFCEKCLTFAEPAPSFSAVIRVACKCNALFYDKPRKPQPPEPGGG